MTVAFLGFAAIGIVMTIVDPAARILGVAIVVMFGGGGLAWMYGEFISKPSPPRMGTVDIDGRGPSSALIIPMKRGKARAAVVAQAAVGVASLIFFLNPAALGPRYGGLQWLFGGVAVVLAIGIGTSIPRWRRDEPMLALTPSGLFLRELQGTSFVAWQGIGGITPFELYGQPSLGVVLNGSSPVERSRGGGLFGALNRSMVGWEFPISLVGLALPPDEVTGLIEHYLQHPDDRSALTRGDLEGALAPIRGRSGAVDIG
jgi:hypothetical protein